MPQKCYTPEEIVAKLRQIEVPASQGASIAEGAKMRPGQCRVLLPP